MFTDSLGHPADTLAAATDTATGTSPSGIDTVVTYSAADSIVYIPSSKIMNLFGKSEIHYRELGLKAELIDIDWNSATLVARGVVDTADTSGGGFRGSPDLIDAGETYNGRTISYNFRTKKGKIDLAHSELNGGYYYGEKIKKVGPDVMFVRDGKYTSCDLPHPHYYFGSPEMRVILNDNIVARPVYLYIADVPVFALPFGIFPNERGRRSGIITPVYGEDVRGRFLERLGYYWAINDYADISLRASGYTGGSWRLDSDARYALRYRFTGSLSGFYEKRIIGERGDNDYSNTNQFSLSLRHDQTIDPTMQLNVDFTFASSSAYQSPSSSIDSRLRQDIRSNATLQKRWEGTPYSMTVNVSRYQQNLPDNKTRVDYDNLPSISFSRQLSYPFRSAGSSGGGGPFFEQIAFSYSGQLRNAIISTPRANTINEFDMKERRGIRHSIPITAAGKIGYFSLTPFFNYTELWYDRSLRREYSDTMLTEHEISAIKAVRYFNTGVTASTKLYGLVQPNIFGITAIRHQVTPSITYTYQPDFSKPSYGYYGTYTDTSGIPRKYSFYENGIFGGAPAGEQQAISLTIGNVFEMKTAASDSTGEEKKYRLLNASAGISYNMVADSLKFSELRLNFNTTIGNMLNLSGGSSFNLYKFERDPNNPQTGRRVNKFLINEEGRFAQLTAFNFSVSTHFSGEKRATTAGPIETAEDSLAREIRSGYSGVYDQTLPDFSIPWNLDLTWSYSQNQSNPFNVFRSSSLAIRLGFNLTDKWKIEASTSYDIVHKEFVIPQITVYRDLHCWEMNFYWEPIGAYRNYRIEIRLKAPDLQDVKVTKTDRSGAF